jgi:feruloyl esterase
MALPNTTITTAALVPPGAFVPPKPSEIAPGQPPPDYTGLPAFCRVAATISPVPDSAINFEVWLPASGWNGKFVGIGNGGFSGQVFHFFMGDPLTRGYAVASTDTGHEGGSADASFALGHPEKLVDFGWRAVHETTVKSKAIVAAHYGTTPKRSYWTGCSSGGRQGLKEAQQFPADYDGIVAGAPAHNWIPLMAHAAQVQVTLTDPSAGVPPPKLELLKEAAIAACDARDGVKDRVVEEPRACSFDPARLRCKGGDGPNCLTAAQVESARKIYAGVGSPRTGEKIYPGPEPGSEPSWFAFTPGVFPIAANYWRDIVIGDPKWQLSAFDLDTHVARARSMDSAGLTTTDANLKGFVGRGGKLLLWHGWTDGLIPARSSIDYYESVAAAMGADAIAESVKLFMAPGVDHCAGGEGTFVIDGLAAIDEWVERGRAPTRIVASRPLEGGKQRTRPLCPYPQVARYNGTGNTDDASSFACGPPTPPRGTGG